MLEQQYLDGVFKQELEELASVTRAQPLTEIQGSGIERGLREICEQELDGRSIDREESLFDIGASSLKLLAIHERLEQLWPGLVDVTDIFDHPSIADLARFIEQKLATTST